jgi:protein TonB
MLALGIHSAGAIMLLGHWQPRQDTLAGGPVIMVGFAVEAAAPETVQTDLPPGPPQPQADAVAPTETASIAPAAPAPAEEVYAEQPAAHEPTPQSAPVPPAKATVTEQITMLTVMPPPRPQGKIEQARRQQKKNEEQATRRRASLASAPSPSANASPRAVAPSPGADAQARHALSNWTSQLVARLERHKRYPDGARAEHGVTQLAFSVDRSGRVHDARILRSSGSALLDRETLALVRRAQPLPPPPKGVSGARVPVVVPIRYRIR